MHLPDQRPGSSSDTRDDFAESPSESVSCSVMSNSLQSYGLQPARLLCLWNSPSKTTGVGSHSLLQMIFRTQGLNPGSLASQTDYFFLFFFLYLFQLEDKYFTILWWFLPYIDMNQLWIYLCSPSGPPLSHLPPHPIPGAHPSAPALSTLSHASNLDWRSVSHMVIYMFQCYFLKSSHPYLLPQGPKFCSLHLCLFCCLAYRVIVIIFLNSIYMS